MKSWALPAAAIVAVEYLAALFVGLRVGFIYKVPIGTYLIAAATVIGSVAAVWVCVRLWSLYRAGEAHPTSRLMSDAPKLLPFAAGALLVALHWAAIMWLKVMLPHAVGFWADPMLANADQAVFGTDPWRIAHRYLSWASSPIDFAYATWAPIKFAVVCAVVLAPASDRKTQALVSYFLLGAVCSAVQYALPAAGPVFFSATGHGARFAQLPVQPVVKQAAQYLWADYLRGGGDVGAGISAMPSVHVAAALWIALVARSFSPRFAVLGFAFYLTILVASVLLGWHYCLDGLAGSAITTSAWLVAGSLSHPVLGVSAKGVARRPISLRTNLETSARRRLYTGIATARATSSEIAFTAVNRIRGIGAAVTCLNHQNAKQDRWDDEWDNECKDRSQIAP